jgi:two-component system, response regulator PdtaR
MTQEQGELLRGFVVLVVDDDVDALDTASLLIGESFGCSVLRASSSDGALRILDSGAQVDLVFSDIVMPKTDGLALARVVRQRWPNARVVLTTGLPGAVDSVIDSGAMALIKPYSIEQLAAVFTEQLHDGGRPRSLNGNAS